MLLLQTADQAADLFKTWRVHHLENSFIMSSLPSAKYEATVITGFEWISTEEVKEKIEGAQNVNHSMGRVIFESNCDPSKIIQLRSVDNVYVIVAQETLEQMPQDNKDDLKAKLTKLMKEVDWKTGLRVWQRINPFRKTEDLDVILTEGEAHKQLKPAFRVTCNRTGEGHGFKSGDAASVFGGMIEDTFKWPVSMKKFDVEIVLNVKDKTWSVCLALTRQSLHRRNLVSLGVTTLRATVCYNMLRLANIIPGDIVCDPLAGTGAIMMEASVSRGDCFTLCGDHNNVAIKHCSKNAEALLTSPDSSKYAPLNSVKFDTTNMPLRTASIDVLVSDLPFGRRIGTKTMNSALYPKLLSEMARVTPPSTGRAILLTQDYKNMKRALMSEVAHKSWKNSRTVFLKLGNLTTHVYCLKRTQYSFE